MKPTCSVNIAPPIAAKHRRQAEGEDLEVGDVVAGEAHAVLLVAHRQQQRPSLLFSSQLRTAAMQPSSRHDVDEVQDELGDVGADVPAEQRLAGR